MLNLSRSHTRLHRRKRINRSLNSTIPTRNNCNQNPLHSLSPNNESNTSRRSSSTNCNSSLNPALKAIVRVRLIAKNTAKDTRKVTIRSIIPYWCIKVNPHLFTRVPGIDEPFGHIFLQGKFLHGI
jgi:hypothetical protein